jgi:cell division protein FtsI (penicillin-binding protein 3)
MSKVKKNINFRIIGLYLIILLLSVSIVGKIVKIQHFNTEINTSSQPRYFTVPAPRGNIIADDGSLLAISMPLYNVRLDMSVMQNSVFTKGVTELSVLLSQLFEDKTAEEYEAFLRTSKYKKANKYILLKNKVSHNQLNALKRMPILKLGQNKGGLIAEQRPNRETPFGLLAQRTVGKLRSVNPVGIERAYNQTLSGIDGRHLKRKIAKGIWVPQDAAGNILPKAGYNVVTTINTDMQDVAEKALERTLIKNDADWGCVVMMEVKTGEVKVIANLRKDTNNRVSEWFNYAMAEHVAPGSTFKLASIIAGLEDDVFKVTDTVDVKGGRIKYYDRVMIDSEHNYDKITISKAFIISSNVGISRIINDNYKKNPTAYTDRIYQMGLSTPLELELPYPNNLKMPVPNKGGWSGVTLPWMSIGYEMQLTPIHMLTFYNAVANKGRMIKPVFVSSITKDGMVIEQNKTEVINPAICSQSTIEKVIPLLVGVVEQGTAKNIKTDSYQIAGKTGTTVLNYTKRKVGEEKKYQASFVGFFPADNPKYSCIVVVNNPKKNEVYGGKVAAPIFKELADKVYASDMSIHQAIKKTDEMTNLPIVKQGKTADASLVLDALNITTEKTTADWMVSKTTRIQVNLLLRKVESDLQKGQMPDLRGMNLQDAIYLLETYGLIVKCNGYGSVKQQSIKKGEQFKKGSIINLDLA